MGIYKHEQDWWFNLLTRKQRFGTKQKKGYYKNNKDRLREQARDKYRSLFEE